MKVKQLRGANKTMKKLNLEFIDNQSHGYLKISIPDLKKYTNQRPENFTKYSFYCPNNDCLYLEEDCDLPEFIKYIENKGYTIKNEKGYIDLKTECVNCYYFDDNKFIRNENITAFRRAYLWDEKKTMNTIEFIKLANKKRLENKNEWIFLNEYVNEIPISYKAFNTWIQVIKYNGIRGGSAMNQNVSEFKKYLLDIIESNK